MNVEAVLTPYIDKKKSEVVRGNRLFYAALIIAVLMIIFLAVYYTASLKFPKGLQDAIKELGLVKEGFTFFIGVGSLGLKKLNEPLENKVTSLNTVVQLWKTAPTAEEQLEIEKEVKKIIFADVKL